MNFRAQALQVRDQGALCYEKKVKSTMMPIGNQMSSPSDEEADAASGVMQKLFLVKPGERVGDQFDAPLPPYFEPLQHPLNHSLAEYGMA